ncbi:receptor kinase-like protein Xa21 isoform X4 [Prosopis cineraria]|uniref:receptor kinase-like protein Xa21 isoform X4 n=1 Tax=Prosopis cineraria TaxID=364024 RepID=UPI00240FEAA8|nr:receptor kinase-like protein Xa21 isoform X4 [Prosopis cineraria]
MNLSNMANLCFHFPLLMFSLLCLKVCFTLCHTDLTMNDELALLAFKFSVKDPYNHLANWSNSSSICNWVGVMCDAHHVRVMALNLGEMGLKGTLPSKIGNLSFLVELDLHSNNLYGELPKELTQLHKLQILNLSYNEFNGGIPTWIGSLFMLQHFHLHNNSFGGFIPKSISNLSKLETLDWNYNFIEGVIPSEIGKLQSLKILRIARNKLSGRIPLTISNLSSLELLSLSFNSLTGDIPKAIGALTNLKILYLGANKLSGQIPRNIGNLTKLQHLQLGENNIKGDIPEGIGKLDLLQELYLSFNNLRGGIPEQIGNLKSLKLLYLGRNQFSGQISSTIFNISELQEIDLSWNNLLGGIPSNICHGLPNLQALHLQANKLFGAIPSGWTQCKQLKELTLELNLFTGHIPKSIRNLTMLQLLNLYSNNLEGIIPATLGGLKNLQDLSLAHNNLQGNIPKSFGNMLSLIKLDLSDNNLSGKIPKSLELLIYLKYVNLSYNKLQGEIPSRGVFKNLTPESFMMNQALCGKPQLQVPPCKKETRKGSMTILLLLRCILPIVVSIILVVLGIMLLRHKQQQNSRGLVERELSTLGVPRRISYFEIQEATNRFDESSILGRGSYGSVFKGTLSNGMIVAVKIFNCDSQVMLRSFEKECDILCNARHRNLVKVISCCSNVDFKSLVMEFMPNGSLERWLYSYNYFLDFLQRLNIMINVATALEYLHHGLLTPIVHCDLKPSNILLDDEMVAHVSDFGISKLLDKEESKIFTETIPTIGYVAPEYGSSGVVSTKIDVYSYGIMLLEVFTRKRPTEDMFVSGLRLKSWVSESMPHAIIQVMDSNLLQGDEHHINNILTSTSSILELALNCCTDLPKARGNMIDVVVSLNKIKGMFLHRQQHHV